MNTRPQENEYAPFYRDYIAEVPEGDVISALDAQRETLRGLKELVPTQKETFAYAPGKWTIRQVTGHLCDAERVFGYRAFAISRGDKTPLPSFDENNYVAKSRSSNTPLAELLDEFALLRQLNLRLFRGFGDSQWSNLGTANNFQVSVRALAYITAGHCRHHLGVLRDRYGVQVED